MGGGADAAFHAGVLWPNPGAAKERTAAQRRPAVRGLDLYPAHMC